MDMVSIVVPTYKRPDVLPRCLDSLINQSYKNIEVIVVDDNPSTSPERNATQQVMEVYQKKYPNMFVYIMNETNIGGSLTRNKGIEAAHGSYITFLDDDDEYLVNKIEIEVSAMIQNNWDVCVMDGATYSQEDGSLISVKKQKIQNGMSYEELMRIHLMYHITNVNTFMYRTKCIRDIGGFDDIRACQEYMLMQKTLDARLSLGYIPELHIKCYIGKGERVSTSPKKIGAQKFLISQKKKYFSLLSFSERRAVLCRHYGVLMNIEIKNHMYLKAIGNLLLCGLASPVDAVKWFIEYKNKIGA